MNIILPRFNKSESCLFARYIEETFDNWGSTLLANVTVRTFFPRTVAGVQSVVRAAAR